MNFKCLVLYSPGRDVVLSSAHRASHSNRLSSDSCLVMKSLTMRTWPLPTVGSPLQLTCEGLPWTNITRYSKIDRSITFGSFSTKKSCFTVNRLVNRFKQGGKVVQYNDLGIVGGQGVLSLVRDITKELPSWRPVQACTTTQSTTADKKRAAWRT